MHTHEPTTPSQPLTSVRQTNPSALHPLEATYPGQEPAASPTNPFPRRPHEVYMGEPVVARKPIASPSIAPPNLNPEPEAKLEKPERPQFRLYPEGQDPPDPPRWRGIQAKLASGYQEVESEEEVHNPVGQDPSITSPLITPPNLNPEPEAKLEKPEWPQFRLYPEGQDPPDPPRWRGTQAKLSPRQQEGEAEREVHRPVESDTSVTVLKDSGLQPLVQKQADPTALVEPISTATPQVQRDGSANEVTVSNFNPSQLEVGAWTPQVEGNVEASPTGDKVTITAPKVTFETTVGLKPSWKIAPGTRIDAGPVQSLLSSERIGVYRKGGLPNGEVVLEQKMSHAASRDATGGIDMKANDVDYAPPPWYSRPNPLNDSTNQVSVKLVDRPKFKALPKQMQGGILTEIRGQDRFIASVGVKPDGQSVVFLKSYQWSVPWDLKIENGIGAGGGVTGAETDQPPPATTGDPTNTIPGTEWQSFPTIEAAMGASASVLLSNLAIAKANDPTSWQNSVEALRRKNPIFRLNITANKLAGLLSDSITVQASGTKTTKIDSLELNTQVRSCTAIFALKEVFDTDAIGASSQLKIDILPMGNSTTWSYPFAAQTTPIPLKGGKGDYTVTGDLV